ncbi:MAG: glutaredoxin [Solobacterium sp.]|nr:glutaredoxin [Solobacterium sp.]
MIKVYGSPLCPDCVACKEGFDAEGTAYEFIDITGSMANLKEFLKLRDTNALYDSVKEAGGVGIPTLILEDGTITLDYESQFKEEHRTPAAGTACRLDGTGC